ncbi:MAG: hypothetical protein Q9185_004748 [Variospora sp. 1 TL-2023]
MTSPKIFSVEENKLEEKLSPRPSTKELDLAKKKLETAQSYRIAGTVARSVWIGLFLDEVEATRVRLNEIRKDKIPSLGPEGLREANKEWLEWAKWHMAEVKASSKERFAEKALRAAQSDDFGETVERAALIRLLLKDFELARMRPDEAIASQQRSMLETARIKGDVLGALYPEPETQPEITSKSFRPSFRKTRAQTPSILSTTNPSKVSKATRRKGKSTRRQKKSPFSSEKSAQAASINPSVHDTRSKQTSIIKQDTTPTPLRPIHSSKVIKSNCRQPTGQQANGTEGFMTADQLQSIRELSPRAAPPARSTGQKPRRKPVGVPTRTSTRISKKPESSVKLLVDEHHVSTNEAKDMVYEAMVQYEREYSREKERWLATEEAAA